MKEFLVVEEGERAPQRLRRKALDLIDSLVAKLEGPQDSKTIHDSRRRLKELRALTLLLGRGKAEGRFFRDAGRELSGARDAKAALEAFDRLRERFASEWKPKQFEKIRRALAARVDVAIDPISLEALRSTLIVERGHIAAWPVDEMRREELWSALSSSYRRARRGMKRALEERTIEATHRWRKRVKMHWYHAQFLTMVSLGHFEARNEALRRLSRTLGDHHDLILIDDICRRTPELFGSARYARLFHTFVTRALTDLFAAAEAAGTELFHEPTREWIAGVRDDEPRLRIGPKKTPPRQTSRPRMLA
jgi:CHAD domain